MRCPRCQTENEEARRFCAECGASLPASCAACGFPNQPGAKFCGGCGTSLRVDKGSPTPAATADIEPIPSHGSAAGREAERRQLTVLFCDLVGSTTLAERLDPEELRELIGSYQDRCADVVNRFDGHIARYVGDGLLVYFGYPWAHEDDVQRAVRAGLGIVEAIQALDVETTQPRGTLQVRIGIATGLVVAGDIGHGERREEKAIVGETPNLAARLQALAEPDAVVIGGDSYRLTEGLFDCELLGEKHLKGMSTPVVAYPVRGETGLPSRFEASAARGLTPLVGREEETGLLLKRWAQAKEGEAQVVLLSGEAGIGKSRIVRGFQESVQRELGNRVLLYGSPYHQNSALHPVIDQMERGLRFEKNDDPEQKLAKLDAVLDSLGLAVDELAPLFASLLSVPSESRYPPPQLSPDELKKRTLQGFIAVYDAMASRAPLLMVVEDAHWLDPSTLELLDLVIEQLRSAPLLLVVTSRPEFDPAWRGYDHVMALALDRLSRRESAELARRVAGGKSLPGQVLDQIVAKTDGVPLFVEELTKTVLESGLLSEVGDHLVPSGPTPSLAIPTSLRDSLMARLDRLASVKEVAQLAATIGRSFSRELLMAISPLNDNDLEDALSKLISAELVYSRGLPPDVTYEFKHALVQNAAYQSLLKRTRQQYHQRIAGVLEEQFPEVVETEPELVAYHYTEGGVAEQAIPYWQRAGERASKRSANSEAIAHFTKGLELIQSLSQTPERDKRKLSLYLSLGPALMAIKGYAAPEVAPVYMQARKLGRRVEDTSLLFAATWGLWLYCLQGGQLEKARALSEEVLPLGEQQDDSALRLQAHHAAWATLFRLAEFRRCLQHTEQGAGLYNFDEHRHHAYLYGGHDPGVCGHLHAALSQWVLGYPGRALDAAQKALTLGERLAHPFSLGDALSCGARVYQYRREARLARERAEAMLALCTEHGFSQVEAWATVIQGWALAAEGQAGEGIVKMRDGLAAMRATGAQTHGPYFLALLAEGYRQTGQATAGLNTLAEAENLIQATAERTWEAEIYRLKGELLLMRSAKNMLEAERCFNRAIEIARRQNAKSLELRAVMSLSAFWCDQKKRQDASDLLAPIYDWFSEGFETADLKEAKTLLDSLS